MNGFGPILGLASLLIIGLGFAWVIRGERYLGYLWWPYIIGLGVLLVASSLFTSSTWGSALVGILGASFIWGATELKEQAVRAELGFYPYKAWKLAGMYGYFEYQNNNHVGTVDNHAGRTYSKIGDEIDLTLTWEYSTHVKLRAGTGFLFDARALGTTQGVNLSVFQMVLDF